MGVSRVRGSKILGIGVPKSGFAVLGVKDFVWGFGCQISGFGALLAGLSALASDAFLTFLHRTEGRERQGERERERERRREIA